MRSSAWWRTTLLGAAWASYRYQPLRVCLPVVRRERGAVVPEFESLFRMGTRVLIVSAHPDDTEFYLGGTLLRLAGAGARLHLVVATDGDKGYYPFARPVCRSFPRLPGCLKSDRPGRKESGAGKRNAQRETVSRGRIPRRGGK